jgi:hypothetical protein
MKKSLSIIVSAVAIFGALSRASAGTVNLYVEDWGSVKSAGAPPSIANVGWTVVQPASINPPYIGTYGAGPNAYNVATGNPVPSNTVYYTGLASGQAGMFYTTDTAGAGTDGDAAFTDINPTNYTDLMLSVAATDQGTTATNYFAVQVGGAWYVSATPLQGANPSYPGFVNASMAYTETASAWNQLTILANSVTIGAVASAKLSGPITGIGIVTIGPGGWNYNEVVISAYAPTPSANLYTEDWGSVKSPGSAPSIANVGWTVVEPATLNPPYVGTYQAGPNPYDVTTGNPVPSNTVYLTGLATGQILMMYTTDSSGAGSEGDSSFTDMDPGNYTNLTLLVEATDENTTATNYFAVQVGGSWYVSTTALAGSSPPYPGFVNTGIPYSQLASAWNQLTVGANTVTIGALASANLSGPITGIGIVQTGPGGWNYNEVTVSAYAPPKPESPPPSTIYSEDWGTAYFNATATAPGALPTVGWSSSGIAYSGTFKGTGSLDPGTGVTFPAAPLGNITAANYNVYASLDSASYIGIFYTTDTNGAGADGDSAFADINPANYAGDIIFDAELQYNAFPLVAPATIYFAVQIGAVAGVGGQWYVSTTPFANADYYPFFASNTLAFNPGSNNWDALTFQEGAVNATGSVTIGNPATNNLSGLITGFGVVEVGESNYAGTTTGYGFNCAGVSVTTPLVNKGAVAPKIDAAGFSQTAYAGGTASFAVDAYVGTSPLTYTWTLTTGSGSTVLKNGATGSGSIISGANTNLITIANVSAADAGTYSVEVGNLYGADYSTNYATNTLTVNPVPSDVLFASTFPFVGPFATAESPTAVGWFAAAPANTTGINYGDQLYAYEGSAATLGLFTSSATDVPGLSGLPFTNINPANFTFVSFRATMANPAGTATVYFAVQMTGGQWYVSSSAIQLVGTAAYSTYGVQFSPAMLEWDTLTLSGSSASIGSTATADLTGDITGAGLVFVFPGTAATEFDVQSFELVTDSTPPVLPSFPSEPDVPYPQTVYAGGGVSFFFTEAGTLPLTNNWAGPSGNILSDGVTATGSIIIGSDTTEITIENVSAADQGTYDPTVSNAAGTNNVASSLYGPPVLTVTPPPVGLIYNESFPLYQPTGGVNQPLGIIGWTNQSDTPNRLYSINGPLVGASSAYAYEGSKTNTLFYASTTTDTGFSGLPFIAFDPATYPPNSIQFTTAMLAGDSAYTNVSASFAVEQGGQWYAMATPVEPVNPASPLSTTAYTALGPQTYSPAAAQWVTLTFVGATGLTVGGPPAQNLSGPITAAGLLFQHGNAGGDLNYNFYQIQATTGAIGGLNIGPVVSNTVSVTWVGNPAVFLQSSTDLIHWTTVPNTQGNHMLTVTATGTNEFYRVAGPQ